MNSNYDLCECSDYDCPTHRGSSGCRDAATITLYRVDMHDETGTVFCDDCASDAMEVGNFSAEHDERWQQEPS